MNSRKPHTALLVLNTLSARALGVGLLLGALVWAMSRANQGSAFGMAMATLMVVAGALSFVLYAADARATPRRKTAPPVTLWVSALGLGLTGAITVLNLLA